MVHAKQSRESTTESLRLSSVGCLSQKTCRYLGFVRGVIEDFGIRVVTLSSVVFAYPLSHNHPESLIKITKNL